MIDAKPDESDLPPIELAAALVRGEPTWHNLCQAAALIRDASAQIAQLTLELAAANSAATNGPNSREAAKDDV